MNGLTINLVLGEASGCWERLTASALRTALLSRKAEWGSTEFRFALSWQQRTWESELQPYLARSDHPIVILVSDNFDYFESDRFKPSPLAASIRQYCKDKPLCCGLIALTPHGGDRPPELDCILPKNQLSAETFGQALEVVASSLWFKAPPVPVPDRDAIVRRIKVECVERAEQLERCFKLRHSVYRLLGYLKHEVEECCLKIEMDGYDGDAVHFIATDSQTGKAAGCARLILPSRFALEHLARTRERRAGVPQVRTDYWCQKLANDETSPVFRQFLKARAMGGMPGGLLGAVQKLRKELDYKAGDICELSRVIVAPDCRGLGISKLLIREASRIASMLGRKCLILECGPHHRAYYQSLGFKPVHQELDAELAQSLNQVALPMYRLLTCAPLPEPEPAPAPVHPPGAVHSPDGLRLSLADAHLEPARLEELTQSMFVNLSREMRAQIDRTGAMTGVKGGGPSAVVIETRNALAIVNAVTPIFRDQHTLSLTICKHAGVRHTMEGAMIHQERVNAIAAELQRFIDSKV